MGSAERGSKRASVAIIAAMDAHRVIGAGQEIPWRLPEDMSRFRSLTMGKPIVMGRRTFDSIGRPLPGRRTVVVSSQMTSSPGVEVVATLTEAVSLVSDTDEIMVCGGEALYREALGIADRMYLTHLDESFAGDVRFPDVDWNGWSIVERERVSESAHPHVNVIYERVRSWGRDGSLV